MATFTRKRKATEQLEDSSKRLRIIAANPSPEETSLQFKGDDEEEDESEKDKDNFSEDDGVQTADTPATPYSPVPKKFPSELKTIKCTYEGCVKTFNRPARLASHLRSHTNERPFVCNYASCEKSYIEEKHLKQHVKGSHTHERSYHCEWDGCGKSFLTATRLRRHRDAHEGHERFRCTSFPPCSQTFRKHQTLQRHIRSDHLELAPFPCTYVDPITSEACQAGFDGAGGLRKHEERVHAAVRFFCPECVSSGGSEPLGFASNAQLQSHFRKSHANCPFCDLRCSGQRELQKHVESQHSGRSLEQRKNVPCTYSGCTKSFTKKYNLSVHIRAAHLGERYICGTFDVSKTRDLSSWNGADACGRDFFSKANLEDHIRTAHMGMPSLINANRPKHFPAGYQDEDEDSEEFSDETPPPQTNMKNKSGKNYKRQKPSAIDELLGNSYALDDRRNIPCMIPSCAYMFIRDYDLQLHMRSKHQVSTPETVVPGTAAVVNPANAEFSFQNKAFAAVPGVETDVTGGGDRRLLEDMYDAVDMEWETQQGILEGRPFWLGADDDSYETAAGVGGEQMGNRNGVHLTEDPWVQDELEMRRLIDHTDLEQLLDPGLREM